MLEEEFSIYAYKTESGVPGMMRVRTKLVKICIFLWKEPETLAPFKNPDGIDTMEELSGFSFMYAFQSVDIPNNGMISIYNPVKGIQKGKFFDKLKDYREAYIEVRDQISARNNYHLIYEGYRNEECDKYGGLS